MVSVVQYDIQCEVGALGRERDEALAIGIIPEISKMAKKTLIPSVLSVKYQI